jgi:hypothetical protein
VVLLTGLWRTNDEQSIAVTGSYEIDVEDASGCDAFV